MKNLWGTDFKPSEIIPAKTIIEEQITVLEKITDNVVSGKIKKLSPMEGEKSPLVGDFFYGFSIVAPIVNNYQFRLFNFSYPIVLMPVYFNLESTLRKELGYEEIVQVIEEDLEGFIGQVLASQRTRAIIESILKISSQN